MRLIDADTLIEDLKQLAKYQRYDRQSAILGVAYTVSKRKTIEPKQEWISVKDRLPEEGRRVLVSLTLNRSYTDIDTDRMLDGNWRRWGRDVTHWMPLPEPPKEEE